jgi:hypothetical protein
VHAMASDFSVAWQCLLNRTKWSKYLVM